MIVRFRSHCLTVDIDIPELAISLRMREPLRYITVSTACPPEPVVIFCRIFTFDGGDAGRVPVWLFTVSTTANIDTDITVDAANAPNNYPRIFFMVLLQTQLRSYRHAMLNMVSDLPTAERRRLFPT
jgi:hypothetical protein